MCILGVISRKYVWDDTCLVISRLVLSGTSGPTHLNTLIMTSLDLASEPHLESVSPRDQTLLREQAMFRLTNSFLVMCTVHVEVVFVDPWQVIFSWNVYKIICQHRKYGWWTHIYLFTDSTLIKHNWSLWCVRALVEKWHHVSYMTISSLSNISKVQTNFNPQKL